MRHPAFAEGLSRPLKVLNRSIPPDTTRNWERGASHPKDEDLHALTRFARPNTWQWKLAHDLKAARYPGVHHPVGEIGKRVLLD